MSTNDLLTQILHELRLLRADLALLSTEVRHHRERIALLESVPPTDGGGAE